MRINPDPYAGGHLFALVHRLTGLFNREDEVMATVQALLEDGVATDDIDIFMGEPGARCLDLSGREHGRAFRLLRTLEAAVGNESEINHRIDDALRRGAAVLCVKVHHRKSNDKARALQILKALHAREIHYWGLWSFEHLTPDHWDAAAKAEVVLRLLRGETLDVLSRELHVPAHEIEDWRRDFMKGGTAGLCRPSDRAAFRPGEQALRAAPAKAEE